ITLARGLLKPKIVSRAAEFGLPAPDMPGQLAVPPYRVPEGERFARLGSIMNGRSFPYMFARPEEAFVPYRAGVINTDDAVDLLELGVWSVDSLERVVQRAGDETWRDAQRSRVLGYVRANCTHAVLARRIIQHYASLAESDAVAA
ncbi:MAG: hypothetical protein AAFY46_16160, partial [Planctomycetota bacterium]